MRPLLSRSFASRFAAIPYLVLIVVNPVQAHSGRHSALSRLDTQARALNAAWHLPSMSPVKRSAQDSDEVDLFGEFEKEAKAGRVATLEFNSTGLDKKARATAEVMQRGQSLIVRVRAFEMPQPSLFGATRYTLWVHLSNYRMRLYLGDLPVELTTKPDRQGTRRGESDCMFHYSTLPVDAVFGGLILTAEPAKYTPVISEALKPLLTTLPLQP